MKQVNSPFSENWQVDSLTLAWLTILYKDDTVNFINFDTLERSVHGYMNPNTGGRGV